MRPALALALIAGCGFEITGGSAPQDGAGGDARSDGGPAMDGTDGQTGSDGALPIEDQDGDGISDPQDNCVAVANATQRDHDGDAFGDACDRCPHLASASDPDADGDGVGDACDPRPANNADRRVLWVGFYDAADIAGWAGQGTFSVVTIAGNGFLQQTTGNTTGYAPPGNVNVPFVMTELVIDSLPNTNGSIGLAVNGTGVQFECTLAKTGSNVTVRSRRLGGNSSSATWPGTFAAGSAIKLAMDMATDVYCRADQGATSVQQIATTVADPTGQTYVGMEGIAARFDYLFVVDEAP